MSQEGDVDDPMTSSTTVMDWINLPFLIVVILAGIFVNWKFVTNMREDDKGRGANSNGILVRDVMSTNAKTQMVIWPTILIFWWMFKEDVEFPAWLHSSFCYWKLIIQIFRIYFAFNSLTIAVMRYTFIVHQDRVSLFGVDKAKRLFYYGSIIIPVLIAFMNEATFEEPAELRGKAFFLCLNSYYNTSNITDVNRDIGQNFSSPLYYFVHQHVSTEITYFIRLFVTLCTWFIFGNIIEGILYWKTFAYITR